MSKNSKDTKYNRKVPTSFGQKVTLQADTDHHHCSNQSKDHADMHTSQNEGEKDIPKRLQNSICQSFDLTPSQFEYNDLRKKQNKEKIQIAETSKGRPALIMGGFMYRFIGESKTSKSWICTKKNCKGRLITSLDGKVILHANTRHNHYGDESKFQNHLLRQACKRKAKEYKYEKPRKIIMRMKEASFLKADMVTPTGVESSKRAIWFHRRKARKKLSSIPKVVTIPLDKKVTLHDDNFHNHCNDEFKDEALTQPQTFHIDIEEDIPECPQNFNCQSSELAPSQFDYSYFRKEQSKERIQFAETSKGRPALIMDGFMYRLKRESKLSKYWQCTTYKCNASLKTSVDGKVILYAETGHSHHRDESKLQNHLFRLAYKRKAEEDLSNKLSSVPQEETTSLDEELTIHTDNFNNHCNDEFKHEAHIQLHTFKIDDEEDTTEWLKNSNCQSSELTPSQFKYNDFWKKQNEEKIHFAETSKGKPALIIDGFIYGFHKKSKTSKNWQCTTKNCNGRVTTSLDGKVIFHAKTHHNHNNNELKIQNLLLREARKRKAEKDLSNTLPSIPKEVTTSLDEEVTSHADDFHNHCNDEFKNQAYVHQHNSQNDDEDDIPKRVQNSNCQSSELTPSQFDFNDLRKQQNEDKIQFSETRRGKPALIMDGFMYSFKHESKTSKHWRCTRKTCNGSVTTSLDEKGILYAETRHNHNRDESKLQNHLFRLVCKRKVEEDQISSMSKEVTTSLDEKVTLHSDSVNNHCNNEFKDQADLQKHTFQIDDEEDTTKWLQNSNCESVELTPTQFDYEYEDKIQFSETSKGRPALIMDGFMYSFQKDSKTSKNWQCTNKKCNGRITTSLDGKVILHGNTVHNHKRDESKFQNLSLRLAGKKQDEEDMSERQGKILMTEPSFLYADIVAPLSVKSSRQEVCVQQNKALNKLSSVPKEVTTSLNETVKLHDDNFHNYCNDELKDQADILQETFQIKYEKDIPNDIPKWVQNSSHQLSEFTPQFDQEYENLRKQQNGDKMQLAETSKGKPALIIDDFIYGFQKETKTSKNWQCTTKTCNGRVTTSLEGEVIFHAKTHNHNNDEPKLQNLLLHQAGKRYAEKELSSNLLSIPKEVTTSLDEKVILQTDTDHNHCGNQSKDQTEMHTSQNEGEKNLPKRLQNSICQSFKLTSSQFEYNDLRKQQNEEKIQITETSKGRPALILGGFMYRLIRESKTSKSWICTKNNCKGRVITLDEKVILYANARHNHYGDESKFQNHLLRQACKRKAKEYMYEKPRKIVMRMKEASFLKADMVTPTGMESSKRAIWLHRRKARKKLSSIPKVVTIPLDKKVTLHDDNFHNHCNDEFKDEALTQQQTFHIDIEEDIPEWPQNFNCQSSELAPSQFDYSYFRKEQSKERIQFAETSKGRPALIMDGFMYRLKRESKMSKYWQCTSNKCNASLKTSLDGKVILYAETGHSHHRDESKLQNNLLRLVCKRKAEEMSNKLSSVPQEETTSLDEELTLHTDNFHNHSSDEFKHEAHIQQHTFQIDDEKDMPKWLQDSNCQSSELTLSQFDYNDFRKQQKEEKIQLTETRKGRPVLIMDGFMYGFQKDSKTSKNWQCNIKKCNGRVTTSLDGKVIFHAQTHHNHNKNESKLQNLLLLEARKRKAKKDLSNTLPSIPKEVTTSLDEEVTPHADNFHNHCNDEFKNQACVHQHNSQNENEDNIPKRVQNSNCQSSELTPSHFDFNDVRKQQNEDKIQFSETRQGKPALIMDGFMYSFKHESKTSKHWRCTRKTCNGSVTTSLDEKGILYAKTRHNHNRDESKLQNHLLRLVCKRKVEEDQISSMSKEVTTSLDEKVTLHGDNVNNHCNDEFKDQADLQKHTFQIDDEEDTTEWLQNSNYKSVHLTPSQFDYEYEDLRKQQNENKIQFSETSKGRPALIMDGFMYSFQKDSKTSKNWQCTNKKCNGRITTSLDGKVILHGNTVHNHKRGQSKFQNFLLPQAGKRKAEKDLSNNLPSIPREVTTSLDEKVTPQTDTDLNHCSNQSKDQVDLHTSQNEGEKDIPKRLQNSNCQSFELTPSQFEYNDLRKQQNEEKIQITETSKGKLALIMGGFMYRLKGGTETYKSWICTNRNCNGRVKTSLDGKVILHENNCHNHNSDESKFQNHLLRQVCKRKAKEYMYEKPRKIIMKMKEASFLKTDMVTPLGVESSKRAIWLHRRKARMKLSSIPKEVDKKMTLHDNNFHNHCNDEFKDEAHTQKHTFRVDDEEDIPEWLQNFNCQSSELASSLFDYNEFRKEQSEEKIQFAETSKGRPALIMDGFMYSLKRESKMSKYWRCTTYNCNANVKTSLDRKVILYAETVHNHDRNESKLQNLLRHKACKSKIEEDLSNKLLSIPKEVNTSLDEKVALHGDDFYNHCNDEFKDQAHILQDTFEIDDEEDTTKWLQNSNCQSSELTPFQFENECEDLRKQNNEDIIQFSDTSKGRPALIMDGFMYNFQNDSYSSKNWQGTNKKCNGRTTTSLDGKAILHGNTVHNHKMDESKFQNLSLRQAGKKRDEEDMSERHGKILMTEPSFLNADIIAPLGVNSSSRATWVQQNEALKELSAIPKEVTTSLDETVTLHGDNFHNHCIDEFKDQADIQLQTFQIECEEDIPKWVQNSSHQLSELTPSQLGQEYENLRKQQNEDKIQIAETSKGKPALIIDGFIYGFQKETKTSKNWQCTTKNCNGRVTTSLDGKVIFHAKTHHNHNNNELKIQNLLLRQARKRKAEKDLSNTLPSIPKEVTTSLDEKVTPHADNFHNHCNDEFKNQAYMHQHNSQNDNEDDIPKRVQNSNCQSSELTPSQFDFNDLRKQENEDKIQFSETRRGKPALIMDGFMYSFKHESKTSKHWRCTRKTCNGSVTTSLDEKGILYAETRHNHNRDESKLQNHLFRLVCKRKVEEDQISSMSKEVTTSLDEKVTLHADNFDYHCNDEIKDQAQIQQHTFRNDYEEDTTEWLQNSNCQSVELTPSQFDCEYGDLKKQWNEDKIQFTETNKGKPALIMDGFMYSLKMTTKTTKHWRCTNKKCSAKVITSLDGIAILLAKTRHNHNNDKPKLQNHLLRHWSKRKAEEDISDRPSKFVLREDSFKNIDMVTTPLAMKRSQRAVCVQRRKAQTKLPSSHKEMTTSLDGKMTFDVYTCHNHCNNLLKEQTHMQEHTSQIIGEGDILERPQISNCLSPKLSPSQFQNDSKIQLDKTGKSRLELNMSVSVDNINLKEIKSSENWEDTNKNCNGTEKETTSLDEKLILQSDTHHNHWNDQSMDQANIVQNHGPEVDSNADITEKLQNSHCQSFGFKSSHLDDSSISKQPIEDKIQFAETGWGKPALIIDGSMYRLTLETKTSKNWRCTNKNCNARVTTSLGGKVILHADTHHNHYCDESKLQNHLLRQACKRKAKEYLSEKPGEIVMRMKEAAFVNGGMVTSSGVESSKRAIWIQRRKARNKMPSSCEEECLTTNATTM